MMSNDELVFLLSINIFNLKQIKEIYTVLFDEISNDKYACFHIKTKPHQDISFDLNSEPEYWTFCFIILKKFPDSMFVLCSDNDVFNNFCLTNNNTYVIDKD